MPAKAAKKLEFYGRFRHGVDDKRRVAFPYRWRPGQSVEFAMLVWTKSSAGACLRVLPPDQWQKLQEEVEKMPSSHPGKAAMKRLLGSASLQTLDNAGRICIPDEMKDRVAVGKEVWFIGNGTRLEIWPVEKYEALEMADAPLLAEALKEFD